MTGVVDHGRHERQGIHDEQHGHLGIDRSLPHRLLEGEGPFIPAVETDSRLSVVAHPLGGCGVQFQPASRVDPVRKTVNLPYGWVWLTTLDDFRHWLGLSL
jgi:hypothetical protein